MLTNFYGSCLNVKQCSFFFFRSALLIKETLKYKSELFPCNFSAGEFSFLLGFAS